MNKLGLKFNWTKIKEKTYVKLKFNQNYVFFKMQTLKS